MILRQFSLRRGSGGSGEYRGGDGVVRELQFTRQLVVSILSERRAFQPWGLKGGGCGSRGVNILTTMGGKSINVGGKNTMDVRSGDKLVIMSPGGGGYGVETDCSYRSDSKRNLKKKSEFASGSLHQYSLDQESA